MGKKEKKFPETVSPDGPVSGSRWMTAGIIVIVGIVAILAILYATGILGGTAAVNPDQCGREVISYINTNLAAANSTATLVSVTEKDGVYHIAARYQGQDMTFYATKNCNYIFSGIRNMKATPTPTPTPGPTTSPAPTVAPVKSARPSVELFVMSFCPYGVQAEGAMKPVVDLLGTRADFTIRYIATVSGDTPEQVKSLHGLPEAKEDLRQLCVNKYYPQKLWPYLMDLNARCYPDYKDAQKLASCQLNVTTSLGMDNAQIETCANGSEGSALLKADETITKSLKVTGSPTLYMNGQRYTGQRTAEAFKQAVCARFETPPAECSVNLTSQAAAATGSC